MSHPEAFVDLMFRQLFARLRVFTILFEDTDVEQDLFGVDESSRVLAISGAGCGVAGLLAHRPERIDAVDLNEHHLALTALKVAAARSLASYGELYQLLGHGHHSSAEGILKRLTAELPAWVQAYWKRHGGLFRTGVYRQGFFYNVINRLHAFIGIDRAWLAHVATLPTEQRIERALAAYGKAFRDPVVSAIIESPLPLLAQGINFRQRDLNLRSNTASCMAQVLSRLVENMARTDVASNWIVWHCQVGEFNHEHPECRPPYLRAKNHERSYGAPTEARFHRTDIFRVLGEAPSRSWSHYNLSDALDWMPEAVQRRVLEEVVRTSRPGATLIIRSVEDRCVVERLGLARRLARLREASEAATVRERSCLYRRTDLYEVAA